MVTKDERLQEEQITLLTAENERLTQENMMMGVTIDSLKQRNFDLEMQLTDKYSEVTIARHQLREAQAQRFVTAIEDGTPVPGLEEEEDV